MHMRDECKIDNDIYWKVIYSAYEVTIIARNLHTGCTKVCEYECDYNYRDGYQGDDILEIYRIVDEFVETLKNE